MNARLTSSTALIHCLANAGAAEAAAEAALCILPARPATLASRLAMAATTSPTPVDVPTMTEFMLWSTPMTPPTDWLKAPSAPVAWLASQIILWTMGGRSTGHGPFGGT